MSIVLRCITCLNYTDKGKCIAFKGKIPKEILSGDNNHSKPLKGQENDIVFEEIKKNSGK